MLLNFICFLPLAASWSTISTKGIPSSSAGFDNADTSILY